MQPRDGTSLDILAISRQRAPGLGAGASATPDPAPDLQILPLPARDDAAFAKALGLVSESPSAFDPWHTPERVGDRTPFWVANVDTEAMRTVWSECVALGRHASMWVEKGWEVDAEALDTSTQVFDTLIYPVVREVLGGSALPEDGQIAVLHAGLLGATGYFARGNLQPPHAYAHSNTRAMILVNLHHVEPGSDTYLGVLAHELQHLAHYVGDPTEDAWFNEGVSMLAEDVCGFRLQERGTQLFAEPDHPLLLWHDDPVLSARDYDAAYLFIRYIADRFGLDTVAQLVQHPDHAAYSIDTLLSSQGGMDDIFADWLVANLLNDPFLADGRYGYQIVTGQVTPSALGPLPAVITSTVANYGADYWELGALGAGSLRVRFAGDATALVGPQDNPSGERVWWSRRGDGVHTWLEGYVDLRDLVTGTLEYALWFDIEPGWDYGYLRISKDAGATWELLEAAASSRYDPLGYAFGPAYTGRSGCALDADADCAPHWIRECLVLDDYCGHEVLLRWDYLTDEAVTGAGLFLDKLAVAGMTKKGAFVYVTAAEACDPQHQPAVRMDWSAHGFLQVPLELAQRWNLIVVQTGGGEVAVSHVPVGNDGEAEWSFEAVPAAERIVVIVAATNRLTATRPSYRLTVEQLAQPSH